jgi:hypothetical protein
MPAPDAIDAKELFRQFVSENSRVAAFEECADVAGSL